MTAASKVKVMAITTSDAGTIALADQLRRVSDRVGLSAHDVAAATGVDEATATDWLARRSAPAGTHAARLSELLAAVETLEEVTRPEAIAPWLHRTVPALQNRTPAKVIASGGYEQVYEIVAELAAGTFT